MTGYVGPLLVHPTIPWQYQSPLFQGTYEHIARRTFGHCQRRSEPLWREGNLLPLECLRPPNLGNKCHKGDHSWESKGTPLGSYFLWGGPLDCHESCDLCNYPKRKNPYPFRSNRIFWVPIPSPEDSRSFPWWTYLDSSGYTSRPGSMARKSGMHLFFLKTPTFKDHISGNLPSNGKENMIHIVLLCLFYRDFPFC